MGKETKRQTVAPILLSIFLSFGQKKVGLKESVLDARRADQGRAGEVS